VHWINLRACPAARSSCATESASGNDRQPARISFSGAPPTLGPVDFVGLTARVKPIEVWHRLDAKNSFLLL
jgi:hypothetical protein